MLIQFTPNQFTPNASGSAIQTFGDDTGAVYAGYPRTVEIESWGLTGMVQEDQMAGQDTPYLNPLGNVKGPFTFRARCSFATIDSGALDFGTKSALVAEATAQGTLKVQTTVAGSGFKTFTYANAILESVTRDSQSNGVKWVIRYQLRISGPPTIT